MFPWLQPNIKLVVQDFLHLEPIPTESWKHYVGRPDPLKVIAGEEYTSDYWPVLRQVHACICGAF